MKNKEITRKEVEDIVQLYFKCDHHPTYICMCVSRKKGLVDMIMERIVNKVARGALKRK